MQKRTAEKKDEEVVRKLLNYIMLLRLHLNGEMLERVFVHHIHTFCYVSTFWKAN